MANVTKRGNTYRIRVSNGEDLNGKQIVESATFRPDPDKTDKQNQKALEQFIVDFERRVKSGKFLDGEKITLQDFWIRWYQEYAMIQLQPTNCEEYSFLYQVHIAPILGNMRLATIQPVAINRLYTSMLQERKDGKEGGYAPATIKRVHALLSSVFATAVQWNILTENPCNRIKPPKNITSNRLVSLPEHIIDLLREYQNYYDEYRASIGSQWSSFL